MKPEGEVNEGCMAVELDTGIYQVGQLYSMEFEIYDEVAMTPEALAEIIPQVVTPALAKYRESGTELEYLGYQSQKVEGKLDGCIVFARPGDYAQIGKNEKTAAIL
jgi:hypothetical protein